MRKIALIIICIITFCTHFHAQSTIPVSGGNAGGPGGTASYSVGQVLYNSHTDGSTSITQGVQQGFVISVETEIADAKEVKLEFSAYPNPAKDLLKLNVGTIDYFKMSFALYDMNGKIVQNRKISSIETEIRMDNLVASTYILKVIQSGKEIKVFKIVKN